MRLFRPTAWLGVFLMGSELLAGEPAPLLTIPAHRDTVRAVAFSPDGKTLATGGYDATVRLWTLPAGDLQATLPGHAGNLLVAAFAPDGKTLASGAVDGVKVWDVATTSQRFQVAGKDTTSVAFSPRGDRLAVGGDQNGSTRILDAATGRQVAALDGLLGDDIVFSVVYRPDGRMIAVATTDMDTRFSLDGSAVTAGHGTTVTLWALDAHGAASVLRRVEKIVGHVWQVAFSPDGGTLAAATEEKMIRLWDVPSGTEREPLRGHTDVVHGVAFAPDGKRLASASMDKTLKLWDASSGKELATLRGHKMAVKCVAFSPDGKLIASGSWDGTARLWDVKD